MTATLYPNRRTDEFTARRSDEIDYTARRVAAAVAAVVAVALLAIVGSGLVGALADLGGQRVAATDIAVVSEATPSMHVAQPGDTLWSIAERYRGDVGHGRYVDALVDVNGGTAIQVGQAVRLP
jgi:nucleoid-associated protein YgaU